MASSAAGGVVIVGSGLIGRSWAMLFASGGFKVKLYDIEQEQITNALENISHKQLFRDVNVWILAVSWAVWLTFTSVGDSWTQLDGQMVALVTRYDSTEYAQHLGILDVKVTVQSPVSVKMVKKELKKLEQSDSLKGPLSAEQQLSLISGCSNITEAVEGAMHIQECVPENLDLKKKIFAQLDRIVDDRVILSSSSSCLMPSKLFAGLVHVKQCIVAHPVNPPYYVPLVELVPHPETAPATMDRTHALMRKIGQSPVRVLKEIDGFVLNRLQYAIISEAWRLVEEGVVSPCDLDLVMSDGLGMRYAFIGPLETMHLNAEGMLSYCDRYSEGMKRVLKTFGPIPEFSGATVEKVNHAMRMKVPDDPGHLAARREWRDDCLNRLAKLKSQLQPK